LSLHVGVLCWTLVNIPRLPTDSWRTRLTTSILTVLLALISVVFAAWWSNLQRVFIFRIFRVVVD
jgi:hypothetical protein